MGLPRASTRARFPAYYIRQNQPDTHCCYRSSKNIPVLMLSCYSILQFIRSAVREAWSRGPGATRREVGRGWSRERFRVSVQLRGIAVQRGRPTRLLGSSGTHPIPLLRPSGPRFAIDETVLSILWVFVGSPEPRKCRATSFDWPRHDRLGALIARIFCCARSRTSTRDHFEDIIISWFYSKMAPV